jgi:hypothetical protein
MTNQHYFLVAGTLNADGSVSFIVDDECDHFSTARPIWTGEEWVSAVGEVSVADATVKDALAEAFYAYYEMNPRPDED